jgi:DNA-binding response OmpR family regulator
MANIVIIENDELMHALLVEWLTAGGYCVKASDTDGLTANAETDVVIVDISEPRHQGIERLCRVRHTYPQAQIIAISGRFRPGMRCSGAAAAALGADRMIAKPFDCAALLAAVDSTIRSAV